jgi:DNA-binding GntR family transcriptional regulator
LHATNARCHAAVEAQDADAYYRENERFHAILYRQSGNGFLEQECLRLHKRLKPFRRMQLRLRGRLRQSMAEHEAIVAALEPATARRPPTPSGTMSRCRARSSTT